MRFFSNWISGALLTVCICTGVYGQNPSGSINGPVLGFVQDPAGSAIQPILGVLGASVFGRPLVLGSDIRSAVISPKQDYALAVRGENAQAVMIRLGTDSTDVNTLAGVRGGVDVIAISPTGTAAALYSHGGKVLQSITRLAVAPQVIFEFDASEIPGRLQGLAVSDDGNLALLNFIDGESAALWVASSTGSRWLVAAERPSAESFIANRHDAVIADDAAQQVFLMLGIDGIATRIPLASFGDGFEAVSGVAATDDGQHVFISSKTSQNITILDLGTGLSATVSCQCQTTGLHRLKGVAVFRLSDPSAGTVALLDASSQESRIIVIPPAQAMDTIVPEEVLPQ